MKPTHFWPHVDRNELFTSHRSVDFTIATNAGRLSWCDGPAMWPVDCRLLLFSWYLIRSLFKSRESLEREIAEMRQQITELEAEAQQAKIDDEDQGHS